MQLPGAITICFFSFSFRSFSLSSLILFTFDPNLSLSLSFPYSLSLSLSIHHYLFHPPSLCLLCAHLPLFFHSSQPFPLLFSDSISLSSFFPSLLFISSRFHIASFLTLNFSLYFFCPKLQLETCCFSLTFSCSCLPVFFGLFLPSNIPPLFLQRFFLFFIVSPFPPPIHCFYFSFSENICCCHVSYIFLLFTRLFNFVLIEKS
ncbi:unnamed protein product [Acanthosepion pharaonis]|uniref:Uncharacterized protein n=1 Tax=Acanthosepion pharaonis TaxID=158019 RepID=A0A812EVS5_ACAPH|nr:unnamed protein product [Sepia pharaonis]